MYVNDHRIRRNPVTNSTLAIIGKINESIKIGFLKRDCFFMFLFVFGLRLFLTTFFLAGLRVVVFFADKTRVLGLTLFLAGFLVLTGFFGAGFFLEVFLEVFLLFMYILYTNLGNKKSAPRTL